MNNKGDYQFKNGKGISYDAQKKNIKYDDNSNIITICFDPLKKSEHQEGIIDGGHTQYAINKCRGSLLSYNNIDEPINNKVSVSVYYDLSKNNRESVVADSINNRKHSDVSVANYRGAFDGIKDIIKDEDWFDRVKFSQLETGEKNVIPVHFLIYLAKSMCDIKLPPEGEKIASNYEKDKKVKKYEHLIPDLAYIYEYISMQSYRIFNDATHNYEYKMMTRSTKPTCSDIPFFISPKNTSGTKGGKFGSEGNAFMFSMAEKIHPVLVKYFCQAILSCFRLFLCENEGQMRFMYRKDEMTDFWHKYGGVIMCTIYDKNYCNQNTDAYHVNRCFWANIIGAFEVYAKIWKDEVSKEKDRIGYIFYCTLRNEYKYGITTMKRLHSRKKELKQKYQTGDLREILIIPGMHKAFEIQLSKMLVETRGEFFSTNKHNKNVINYLKKSFGDSKQYYDENTVVRHLMDFNRSV